MAINKSQGATVGAILLAGLLLRPVGSNSPQLAAASNGMQGVLTSSKPTEPASEGPWIASCKYWAVDRTAEIVSDTPTTIASPEGGSKTAPPDANGKTVPTDGGRKTAPHETRYTVDLRAVGQVEVYQHPTPESSEANCGDDPPINRWGLPDADTPINVTAIIATIPDPVHTHLAMSFDRKVDALLQAASDNFYLTSYYWLPWKRQIGAAKAADASGETEPGHDPERERQPGLIVLKSADTKQGPQQGHYRVIYLFLVGDSPTEGVNGSELQYALAYENELANEISKRPGSLFFKGRGGHTAIIGPIFTGSAASLRAGVVAAHRKDESNNPSFDITGTASTKEAADTFKQESSWIQYLSFGDNSSYDTQQLRRLLVFSGFNYNRVAFLFEDNTALGNSGAYNSIHPDKSDHIAPLPLTFRFPREISLLRNAKGAGDQGDGEAAASGSVPSPYLHLSLKDSNAHDSVPQFSPENTPLSQEAQLMTIARELQRDRIQFIVIKASNPLDQIFLAQFLHRDLPDARLIFMNADLLMVREIDNVPYVGTITITPYSLIGLGHSSSSNAANRAYPESDSIAFYNAASYTIWEIVHFNPPSTPQPPIRYVLKSYVSLPDPNWLSVLHPSLWATAIGTDGYYPLAIINPSASDVPEILPAICSNNGQSASAGCPADQNTQPINSSSSSVQAIPIYPSLAWVVLCSLVLLLCLLHTIFLFAADYRSPFTRDLDIRENDQPRLRSVYLWVCTAMLFSMAFVVAWPLLSVAWAATVNFTNRFLAGATLLTGGLNLWVTYFKTKGHIGWAKASTGRPKGLHRVRYAYRRVRANVEFLIHCLSWLALAGISVLWVYCCQRNPIQIAPGQPSYSLVGLCFSFRCIHPSSGVSPVVPVLFLLFAWYIWGFFQTRRLRFSKSGRPSLPEKLDEPGAFRYFVAEEYLGSRSSSRNPSLYEDVSCLFVTRLVLRRFTALLGSKGETQNKSETQGKSESQEVSSVRQRIRELRKIAKGLKPEPLPIAEIAVILLYAALLFGVSFFNRIRTFDHFLWSYSFLATPYEILVGLLFLPLVAVTLAGWLRMIFIWTALSRGLLNRLESQPIRYAFDRLQGMGWMAMLRLGGLREQWRDTARSVESIRQMLHQEELATELGTANMCQLQEENTRLLKTVGELIAAAGHSGSSAGNADPLYRLMKRIEDDFARFGQKLLSLVLIPYWRDERTGLVESKEIDELPIKARHSQFHTGNPPLPLELHTGSGSAEPAYVQAAEEFLAIRYVSLIRAVMANMRYLMSFVSVCFVLAIVAWNSYPFQPRYEVDWFFTFLLFVLGGGIIWVFAEMHRDPILSRITETNANELGIDFYIRIVTFGAVPVLTWLAYQFPEVGNFIFKFLQPGLGVIK